MLLPNMTHDEIRKLLTLEYEGIKKRNLQYFAHLRREVIKKKLKNKRVVFYKRFTTKNKTKWLVRNEKYKGDKYKVISIYGSFFRDTKGMRYVEINTQEEILELDIYNAHFMQRYVERLNLDLTDSLEIIKTFFERNTSVTVLNEKEEIEPGVFRIASQVPEGVKLGILDENRKVTVWNTFISANEYKGNQKELRNTVIEGMLYHRAEQPGKYNSQEEEFLKRLIETI